MKFYVKNAVKTAGFAAVSRIINYRDQYEYATFSSLNIRDCWTAAEI
jgi:hypothetical protein